MQKILNLTLSGFTYAIWQFVYVVRFLACVRGLSLVQSLQSGSGVHPASYSVGTKVSFWLRSEPYH
jgi:hypothetical protein